jgi:DNA repair protein RecO (recombination protein O)
MRSLIQPAFVLHRRPYRETSVLLDVLTQEQGRLGLIARGARLPRSPLRSLLQPFTPLLISFQGKTDLMTLTSVEAQTTPLQLHGDGLLSGFYLNELLVRVLQKNDPHPQLYTLYHQTLVELQRDKLDQTVLRLFEKNMLAELGYAIPLQHDFLTGKVLSAEQLYQYVPEQGFTVCAGPSNCAGPSKDGSHIFSGRSLLALASEQLIDQDSLRDAKRLMRLLLLSLLGRQPIYSRQLFK